MLYNTAYVHDDCTTCGMIKLIKSTFYKERETKKRLVSFIARAKHLSFGRECQRFEKKFSVWQRKAHCAFVNSGSSANLALFQALLNVGRLKKGDAVGFSSCTWSTNVMPLIQLGLTPIPIDVELDTLNVSSEKVERVLHQRKLKALFLTNLLGLCDDIDKIAALCRKKKVLLLEDNCEALGSVYRAKLLGNYGFASTFSFYVGHHLSTIEGGAVCTDDTELASMLQIVRAHGWDRNLSVREQNRFRTAHKVNSTFYSRYTFYDLGFNLRPTEINGFLGITQMAYVDEIVRKRQENFFDLAPALYAKTRAFLPLRYDHMDVLSSFSFPLICRSVKIRERIVDACAGKIEIRPIVGGNIVRQPFFRKYAAAIPCPNADIIHARGLYFGNNPEMTRKEKKILRDTFVRAV
jgi:CDP-6-deoxy-D-xylo-4-hexulose-3-dehydrase